MSNLLKDASILLTPTGYDNGKMLSIKPEDGDGDFTFSRNSAATRVNAQGLVENVQILSNNLVQNGSFSQIGTEEVTNGSFSQEGVEQADDSVISNAGSSIMTKVSALNYNATSDGTGGSTIRPRLLFNNTTIGKSYRIKITPTNQSGTIDFKLFDGSQYVISGNDLTTDVDLYFKAEGASILVAFDGTNTFNVDFEISLKEVGQDWTLETGWSIGDDKAISDGSGSIPDTDLVQGNVFTTGKSYKVTLEIKDYVSGNLQLQNNTTNFPQSNGIHTIYSSEGGTSLILRSLSFIGSITNISVKEVGQNWTIEDTWTIGNSVANGNGANGGSRELIQTSVLYIGKEYKATYQVLNYASGSVALWKGSGVALIQRTANGTYTEYFTAASNQIRFRGANFIGSITNIVIKEVTNDTNLPRINYEGFSYQDSFGSELVTNGDFATNSYWQLGSGSSISGGSLNIISAPYNAATRQALSLTSGKTYKIVINAIAVGSATSNTFQLGFGTIGGDPSSNTQYEFEEGASVKTLTVTASATDAAVLFRARDASTSNLSITNVSVKEYLGQEVVPDSGCGSWLLEPQSTNIIPYSTDFTQWTFGSDGFPNNMTRVDGQSSLDGGTNSSLYTRNSGTSGFFGYGNTTVVLGNTYTYSIFIKKGTSSTFQINNVTNAPQSKVTYNIDTDTFTQELNASGKAVNFGDGWYRLSMTYEHTNTANTVSQIRNYLGDGESMYVFGAQLEVQSFATSYIPTSGASSTRLQDLASDSGNSTLINSTEGVLYFEGSFSKNTSNQQLTLNNGTTSERIVLEVRNNGQLLRFNVRSSDTNSVEIDQSINTDTYYKLGLLWSGSIAKFYLNGSLIGSDSSVTYPIGLDSMSFNSGTNSFPFFGKVKALAVYKEALTDAELTCLTTI